MEWHTGYTLPQTVYSFLHVHALRETDPELIAADQNEDPWRPLALVTVILGAYTYGLLKSNDLSWRELNKGNVYDVRPLRSVHAARPLRLLAVQGTVGGAP